MGVDLYLENLYNGGPCGLKHCKDGNCRPKGKADKTASKKAKEADALAREAAEAKALQRGFREGLDFAIRAAHRTNQSEVYIRYLEEVRRVGLETIEAARKAGKR